MTPKKQYLHSDEKLRHVMLNPAVLHWKKKKKKTRSNNIEKVTLLGAKKARIIVMKVNHTIFFEEKVYPFLYVRECLRSHLYTRK